MRAKRGGWRCVVLFGLCYRLYGWETKDKVLKYVTLRAIIYLTLPAIYMLLYISFYLLFYWSIHLLPYLLFQVSILYVRTGPVRFTFV